MRLTAAIFIAATVTELGAEAIHLQTRSPGQSPQTVHQTIRRRHVTNPASRDRRRWKQKRQDGTLNVPLDNELFLYYMEMTAGNPEQEFLVHLDTGSSDLWFNVPDSEYCSSSVRPCQSGTYSVRASDTIQFVSSDFYISYVDDTSAQGDYVTDTVRFGGVTLDNQQFGLGYVSSTQDGILGIGYPLNEVALSNGDDPYDNVPAKLVTDGYIATPAYSLWLNDLEAAEGSILFGGVNTEKYQGELETIAIPRVRGAYRQFLIPMLGVGRSGQRDSISGDLADVYVHLDSGASFSYLPENIAQEVYSQFSAQYQRPSQSNPLGVQDEDTSELAFVDCGLADDQETLDFRFQNDKTIQVPMNELVFPYDNNGACVLGILPAVASSDGQSYFILGDTVLRSAYVVYDMGQNEISIAQTIFNTTEDNIVALGRGQDVPDEPGADGETFPPTENDNPGQSSSSAESLQSLQAEPTSTGSPGLETPSVTVTVTVANPSATGESQSGSRPKALVGSSLLVSFVAILGLLSM